MRRVLPIVLCCAFPASVCAHEDLLPDGSPLSGNGGLIFMRQGNQTTLSLGGALLPRKVRVITDTPEGPVETRFTLPSAFQGPHAAPFPFYPATAMLRLEFLDPDALLFVEGVRAKTSGAVRYVESPVLAPGEVRTVRLRAAYVVGKHFLIEDRVLLLHSGERTVVKFDGSQAVAVPMPAR
jgi:hypothetical protein